MSSKIFMSEHNPPSTFRWLPALGILGVSPLLASLTSPFSTTVMTVFFIAVLLWFSEAIPLAATALLIPVMISVLGILPAEEAFASFGDPILFLFIGCFLMSLSIHRFGLDRRIAYWLLSRFLFRESLLAIHIVVCLSSFFLSMWISNTAATAIMVTVAAGILETLRERIVDKQDFTAMSIRLILGCAFAASIGGLATPIGSPPNLIALKLLQNQGVEFSFFDWLLVGLPIAGLMLCVLLMLFHFLLPIADGKVEGIRSDFASRLVALGPMRVGEKQIAAVFAVTILAWVLPGLLHKVFSDVPLVTLLNERLSMSVVGLSGGLLLFFLPLRDADGRVLPHLAWRDATQIEWGTVLLFGGGLALGSMLEKSGTAALMGELLFQGTAVSPGLLVLSLIVLSIAMSEFASNTAAAAILIPLVIGAAAPLGLSTEHMTVLVLAVAFASSFGFMLPVSTPPNAIAFSTGQVPLRKMISIGFWFDLSGGLLIAGAIILKLTVSA